MAHLNPKGPGKCIFCGQTGLTKEHVFPDWLKNVLPRTAFPTNTQITSVGSRIAPDVVAIHRARKGRQGNPATRQVRVVCKRCNGGWMSALEEKARPILVPLIRNDPHTLRVADHTSLAGWIAKTTITNEFTDAKNRAIPTEDRNWVMDKLEPPPRWRIWVGAHNSEKWITTSYHHAVGLTFAPVVNRRAPVINAQSTTFGIGNLLILAISFNLPASLAEFQEAGFPGMTQLWPVTGADMRWPVGQILSESDADSVANGMADDLAASGHTWPKLPPFDLS